MWSVTTAAVAALLWWLHPDLVGSVRTAAGTGPTPALETVLGQGAALAAAGCAGWAWTVTTVTVAQAATGRERRGLPGCPAAWRGVVLAACGVAVLSGLTAPAQAHDGRRNAGPGATVVAGLPLPERPTGRLHHPPPDRAVLVEAGDSLWSLAIEGLPVGADAAAVTAAWHRLYARNRAVIGSDPDLLRPGQRLALGSLGGRR